MPRETTNHPQTIIPGSTEDPYAIFSRRVLEAFREFLGVVEMESAEYWGRVAQFVQDNGDEDPGWPGNLRADPGTVIEAIKTAQETATTLYRGNCHAAALAFTKRLFFAIEGARLGTTFPKSTCIVEESCQDKSD